MPNYAKLNEAAAYPEKLIGCTSSSSLPGLADSKFPLSPYRRRIVSLSNSSLIVVGL
jgi:hypothetical protein